MLVNWFYSGIRTLLFLWWTIIVESVLKGICIERPPVSKNSLNKQFIPTKYIHVFLWLVLPQKGVISYSKIISDVKNGEAKKVKIIEWLKGVKLL